MVLPPLVTLRRERGRREAPRGAGPPPPPPLRHREGPGRETRASPAARVAVPARSRLSPADADDDVHGASGGRPARLLLPVSEGRGGPGVSGTGRLGA